MFYRIRCGGWALLAIGLLAACGAAGPSAQVLPSAAATTQTALAAAPSTPAAIQTAPAAAPGAAIPEGTTAEGYHMLGRPEAPVTLTMYSDFL